MEEKERVNDRSEKTNLLWIYLRQMPIFIIFSHPLTISFPSLFPFKSPFLTISHLMHYYYTIRITRILIKLCVDGKD